MNVLIIYELLSSMFAGCKSGTAPAPAEPAEHHPFDPGTAFRFGLKNVESDCLELWNGPFTAYTRQCLD